MTRRVERSFSAKMNKSGWTNYGYTLTLLVMPEAERRWRRWDEDEELVEDSYDRFSAGGRVR